MSKEITVEEVGIFSDLEVKPLKRIYEEEPKRYFVSPENWEEMRRVEYERTRGWSIGPEDLQRQRNLYMDEIVRISESLPNARLIPLWVMVSYMTTTLKKFPTTYKNLYLEDLYKTSYNKLSLQKPLFLIEKLAPSAP